MFSNMTNTKCLSINLKTIAKIQQKKHMCKYFYTFS